MLFFYSSYPIGHHFKPNDYKCQMQTDTRLQPLLWRENQDLKQQLRDAHLVINTLRSEIQMLRKQLSKYEDECTFESNNLRTPKMKIQEHFQWSSDEETDLSPKANKSSKPILNFSASFANSSPLSNRLRRIDTQRSIRTDVKSENSLFKRQSNSRPIFECFFVTGITREGPCISYCYPQESNHTFDGYLSLMYGETIMRTDPLSPRKKEGEVREIFVIPIIKEEGRSSEKNYLIVCEVEEAALGPDLSGMLFPRYYCFLSQWKFFKEFHNLVSQLTNQLLPRRKDTTQISEGHFGLIIQQQAQNFLRSLRQKNTNFNTTVDCSVGALRFIADVPAEGLSFQLVKKYLQWGVAETQVQVKGQERTTQLLGLLLAYAIMEKKLLLYSAVKSKVSEIVIQLLQALRPLAFAGPVLVAALREQHENYLDAPVPLIMGLWAEQRRPSRQKIEIFMNRKLDLLGLIEKAKLEVPDGLIVNLDTGLAFGGAADPELNAWAARLNTFRLRLSEGQSYHLLGKLISQQCQQSRCLWSQVRQRVQGTQMYCYYCQHAEE